MSDIRSFEIDLDLKQNILVTLPCKQLDNLNIKFNIWNNGQVADINNYKCRLKALKRDYTPLIQNTDISISDNIVTVEADEQLTTTSGMVKTELQFIDKTTGKKKSSFNLNIKVVSGALEVDRTISKATITLLEQLDNKLDQIEDIEAVVEEAKIVKDELVTKTNEANTIKNELEAATTNAENKENEINTAVTNANNKIEEVNISISNANASKEALDTSKKNADTLKESLDESIDIGNTLKTNLDEANSLATNNKTALDNSNQNATNTKNELEELNSNATNIKNELDNSNSLAATNKSELDKANNLAQTNKTALDEANTLAEHNIEELNKLGDVTELAKQVETNKTDIASINNKIGTTELTTNDKSITGAIEEVKEIADNNTTQLNALANPSLLINGDFRNPVNQRRKSSYNVNGEYTIDRWRFINDNNGTMTINDGYISISNGVANNTYLQYNYDTDMKVLEGEKVTFTIVYKSTATYRLSSFIGSAEEDVNIYLTPIDDWTVKTLTLDLSSWKYSIGKVESSIILQSYDGSSFTNGTLDVKYIKLELGSVATPFIPRLYGEELALCQRYGEPIRELPQSIRNTLIQTSYMVEKRLTPTLKIKSMNGVDDKVSYWSGTTWIDLEILNKNWTNQSMCTIEFNKGSLSGDLFINFSAFADSEIY